MSSKDKSKKSSNNSQRNIIESRGLSAKNVIKKSDDGDRLISKGERSSKNRSAKDVVERISDVHATTSNASTQNLENDYDEIAERRRRRKEKEKMLLIEKERERQRDSDKINLRENMKKDLADQDESNNRRKHDKNEKDYSKSKNKTDKEDESKNRRRTNDDQDNKRLHRTDQDEVSKGKHRTDKDESKSRHRRDKEDLNNGNKLYDAELNIKTKSDNEESKSMVRVDRDEHRSKHKDTKEESSRRHRSDKVGSIDRHSNDKGKDEDRRKHNSHKDRVVTDGRGDKIVSTNEKEAFTRKDDQLSNNVHDGNIDNKSAPLEYDEEFDDYNDDDFEDVNSSFSTISEGKEVIEDSRQSYPQTEEIKSSFSRDRNKSPTESPIKNKDGIHSSFINFRLAQKKCSTDAIANKMLSRAYDLARLIDLDRSHFDILDLPPVSEHGKYMVMFGRAGCQHIGTQTGDDNMGRESQTEVIDERTVWSQHPPLDDEGCVRVMMDTARNNMASLFNNESTKTALEMLNEFEMSSAPLVQTLQLMDRVLEEEAMPEVTTKIPSTIAGQQMMSLGYSKYSCEGLPCVLASFSAGNSAIFVTVHQQSGDENDVTLKSFVALWRVSNNQREPQRYFTCPNYNETKSCISSLIFSPDSCPSHLFAGLDSGMIALWDLREPITTASVTTGDPPAYFTGVPSDVPNNNCQSPIIALHTSSSETNASSYQLLSLDSSGNLSIWIVSSLFQTGSWALASGSLADLNLRPGARCRMSIIATISLFSGISNVVSSITCMTVDPANSSHIFVGNQNGHIIHHDRTVQKPMQGRGQCHGRIYGTNTSFECGSIMCLDFYPFFEPYFLAGYSDGSLKIFTLGRSEALISFTCKQRVAILMCRWSKSHPAVFFSLDCDGNFSIWNILQNVYKPLFAQQLPNYVGFDLSCDSRWTRPSEHKTVHNKARLLIWALDGSIEVHELHPSFVVAELDHCFKTCAFLQSLL